MLGVFVSDVRVFAPGLAVNGVLRGVYSGSVNC